MRHCALAIALALPLHTRRMTMPDAQRPSTWKQYKRGMCEGCWAGCCTLPVEVSASDLIRLELVSEEEAAGSMKAVAKRLTKDRIIQAYSAKSQLFVLEQRYGQDC